MATILPILRQGFAHERDTENTTGGVGMEQWERLDAAQHAGLRLMRSGDSTRHFVQVVTSEFAIAARDYPILFTKHPETGAFYAGVVMGLKPGENLYVDGADIVPGYRPADLERQGFFMLDDEVVIDRTHPVFADGAAHDEGEAVFDSGQPAAALRRVLRALGDLKSGLPASEAFIARLLAARLLEPIDIALDFDDGERLVLEGLYTISLDALHGLPDDAALAMFRNGDLRTAYAQIGSVQHIRTLARRRNDRLAG